MQFFSLSQRDQPQSWHFSTSPADKREENFIAEFKPVIFFFMEVLVLYKLVHSSYTYGLDNIFFMCGYLKIGL